MSPIAKFSVAVGPADYEIRESDCGGAATTTTPLHDFHTKMVSDRRRTFFVILSMTPERGLIIVVGRKQRRRFHIF